MCFKPFKQPERRACMRRLVSSALAFGGRSTARVPSSRMANFFFSRSSRLRSSMRRRMASSLSSKDQSREGGGQGFLEVGRVCRAATKHLPCKISSTKSARQLGAT